MTMPDAKDLMLQRHEIVMRIMAANSRRLHLDNEINGLDIERRIEERDLPQTQTGDAATRLQQISERLASLKDECSKIQAEREWLEQALTDFDRGMAAAPKKGNA